MNQSTEIYKLSDELLRLGLQSNLLRPYEQPVYTGLLEGHENLTVLDMGCNDGCKTVGRFSDPAVSQVIGLDFHDNLVTAANRSYGGDRFRFYQCDVEDPDLETRLEDIMQENGIACFDVINMSFLLLHLQQPAQLLARMRRFLRPGGTLIIIEANDSVTRMEPDENHYMEQFLAFSGHDLFAGNRNAGHAVPDMLTAGGYRNVTVHREHFDASDMDQAQKKVLFDTCFSFIPMDYEQLCQLCPDNEDYAQAYRWLTQSYPLFRSEFIRSAQRIICGFSIVSCIR